MSLNLKIRVIFKELYVVQEKKKRHLGKSLGFFATQILK